MSSTSNDALSPKTFVNLLTDSGFKAVYTDRSNMDLLIELLNCLLPEEARVEEIESFEDREQRTPTPRAARVPKGNDPIDT